MHFQQSNTARRWRALPLLFVRTANGANASATLYSLVETARANGLVPYDYLMHVMNEITAGNTDPEKLLPWNVNLG